MNTRNASAACAALVLVALAPSAPRAQDTAPLPPAAPAPAAQPATAPPPSQRDGARVLGRLGLGTFRRIQFDLGGDLEPIPVDAIGLRYWFPGGRPGMVRAWGVDVGVSFAYRRDSVETAGVETKATSTAIGVHGGLPLVLAQLPHANFEVVPELDVVLLGGEQQGADLSGVAVDLGARAGFEVFFGFVGLSDLSLEASVGFGIARTATTLKEGGVETKRSTTFVGFQKLDDPWDIFRASVAARYYF